VVARPPYTATVLWRPAVGLALPNASMEEDVPESSAKWSERGGAPPRVEPGTPPVIVNKGGNTTNGIRFLGTPHGMQR